MWTESWWALRSSAQPHHATCHTPPLRLCVAAQHDARQVSWGEGAAFAAEHGCLFVETSAKQNVAVGVALEELLLRILQTPSLLADAAAAADTAAGGGRRVQLAQSLHSGNGAYALSCSC